MKVTRIAYTVVDKPAMEESTDGRFDAYVGAHNMDLLVDFSGRACYDSFHRPNPATRETKDYIRSTVHEKGHESIMAHASVTYYITGVSRALTHELIRHRFLAFSELSQRYVDMENAELTIHPALADNVNALVEMDSVFGDTVSTYGYLVDLLIDNGLSRKQAREAARAVLPSAIETKIVVSGNLRAWRDFLKQRWSVHADAEIRNLAGEILKDLRLVAPHSLADIPEEPYQ